MNWHDLTVKQYQSVASVVTDKEMNDLEKETELVAILSGLSREDLNAIPWEEYLSLRKKFSFVHNTEITGGRPVLRFEINGRSYSVQHDFAKIAVARYVEVKHFAAENFIKNLHLLIASVVKPDFEEYDVKKHQEYANDFLSAKFIDVHATAVFFYQLFENLIADIPDFIANQMRAAGLTEDQISLIMNDSRSVSDGSTTSSRSQSSSV
jgi:hypothetical protein